MFSVVPVWYIRKKVATTEIGIETPMIRVLRRSLRKKSSIRMAKKPPIRALTSTSRIEASMNRDWSTPVTTSMPSGNSPLTEARRACSERATLTVLASPSL